MAALWLGTRHSSTFSCAWLMTSELSCVLWGVNVDWEKLVSVPNWILTGCPC